MDPLRISIRHACQEDTDAMVSLLQALFAIEVDFIPDPARQYRGLAQLLNNASDQRCILVAETDRVVVGMATLQVLISTAEGGPVGLVEDVVVEEKYRGCGVGQKLMDSLVSWSIEHGLSRLQLLADLDNQPALDFYEKNDWQSTQLICLRKTGLGPEN